MVHPGFSSILCEPLLGICIYIITTIGENGLCPQHIILRTLCKCLLCEHHRSLRVGFYAPNTVHRVARHLPCICSPYSTELLGVAIGNPGLKGCLMTFTSPRPVHVILLAFVFCPRLGHAYWPKYDLSFPTPTCDLRSYLRQRGEPRRS